MNIHVWRCVVAFALLAAAGSTFAGEFKSKIISGTPLVITVPEDRFLKITNFTQEGGVGRGVVTVTLQGDNQTNQTATVLAATRIDLTTAAARETIAPIIVAGPAMVTVMPVQDATLFISYRKEPNDGFGGATTTPISISPAPTPTCTVFPPVIGTPCPQ